MQHSMMEMGSLRDGDGDDGFVDYVNGFVVSGGCDGFVDYVNAMAILSFRTSSLQLR